MADVSPSTAAFFRAAYATPVLFLGWLAIRRHDQRTRAERLLGLVAGVLLALDFTFWHRAIEMIGAGLATVLGNTQIAFVGIVGWLVLKEKPSRTALFIVPVMFLGVVLISGLGRPDAYGQNPFMGVVYGVLTGITYAAFLLVFRNSNQRALAPSVAPLFDATVGAAVGSLLFAVTDAEFSLAWSWPEHGWLITLALVSQVLGWLMISSSLPRLPALETSIVLLTQPMLTVLWGALIFAEYLSPIQWTGVVFVLGGIATVSIFGASRAE